MGFNFSSASAIDLIRVARNVSAACGAEVATVLKIFTICSDEQIYIAAGISIRIAARDRMRLHPLENGQQRL